LNNRTKLRHSLVMLQLVAAQIAAFALPIGLEVPQNSSPASTKSVELFVDPYAGADTNDGSPATPLKSASAAAALALANKRAGTGTVITLRPGIYREFIDLNGVGVGGSNAPIVIRAEKPGGVTISGSYRWTDWVPDPADSRRYIRAWPYHWQACTFPAGWPKISPLGLRREMIFVNAQALTPVLSLGDLKAGSFFIDETAARVYLRPPEGISLTTATVEVAIRPSLFRSSSVSNLTLSGLVFEHANSCFNNQPNAGVTISGGHDVTLEDLQIDWNNWIGVNLFSINNAVVRRVEISHNGESGLNAFRLKNADISDVDVSDNNWRGGGLGGFRTWEPAGAKLLRIHGAVLRNIRALRNDGRGLWFDTDNLDVTLQNITVENNSMGGIDIEASKGPFLIKDSFICNNLHEGLQGNQSDSLRLTHDVIAGNQKAQIWASISQKPRTDTNWETKASFSTLAQHWVIEQSTIASSGPHQMLYEGFLSADPAPGPFLETLTSDRNHWYKPDSSPGFQMDSGYFSRPAHAVSFSEWREITGQDKHSDTTLPGPSLDSLCPAPSTR